MVSKRAKPYVGVMAHTLEYAVFTSYDLPLSTSHGQYAYVIGPFRSRRAAQYLIDNRGYCHTVAQANKATRS